MALAASLLANRAARANDLEGITAGTNSVALLFLALGRERLAVRYLSRSLQAAERYGDPLMLAQVKQGVPSSRWPRAAGTTCGRSPSQRWT